MHAHTHRIHTHTERIHTHTHTQNTHTERIHTHTHTHTHSNSTQNTLTWFVYNVPEEGLVLHQMGDDMTCLLCLKKNQSNRKSVNSSTSHSLNRPCSASPLQHHPVQPEILEDRAGQRDGATGTETSPQPLGWNSQQHHLPYCILPSHLLSPTISPTESHHLPYCILPSHLLSPTISPTESHDLPY